MLFKQTIVVVFSISDLFVHERLVDDLIFLSNKSFSSILENAQFEITKLAHVLNANHPYYQLFRETSYSCLHHVFITDVKA